MPQRLFLETNSSGQTKKFAGFLASVIARRVKVDDATMSLRGAHAPEQSSVRGFTPRRSNLKSALIFALTGDLGSGKTTFVQGFLRAAGIKKKITSPTFVLIKNYKLQTENYKQVYHIDCYRIKKSKELSDLGLKKILNNPENIVLIEWPEKIKKILPKDLIWIKFEHSNKINQRIITILSKRSSG